MQMKNLRGQCRHCGGRFDFPAAQIGTMGDCPHCGRTIEMMLETPKTESAVPRRVVVYSLLAIALLGLGLLATAVALKRARSLARQLGSTGGTQTDTSTPRKGSTGHFLLQTNDFQITPATISKDPTGPLFLAVGVLSNRLNRPRFGVQLTFDVLDAGGRKVGTAMDAVILVEPLGKWQFRAPLLQTNAASVRFASILEGKQP